MIIVNHFIHILVDASISIVRVVHRWLSLGYSPAGFILVFILEFTRIEHIVFALRISF
jgi:hypothetical protein